MWAAEPAAAGSPLPALSLRVSPCLSTALDEDEVRRLLSIELGSRLLAADWALMPPGHAADPARAVTAVVDCTDGLPYLADLRIEDGMTGKTLQRSVDLSALAQPVYARLIALSLAELLYANWTEILMAPAPPAAGSAPAGDAQSASAVAPPAAAESVPAGAAVANPKAVVSVTPAGVSSGGGTTGAQPYRGAGVYGLAAGGLWVGFGGEPALVHGGGGLRLGGDHAYHIGWDVDAQVQHAQARVALGDLTSNLLSLRAALQVHAAVPYALLRVGAGLRAGAAQLSGMPSDPTRVSGDSLWAPWGGPVLSLSAAMTPPQPARLRVDLALEVGYVLWSVTARVDGQRPLSVAGPWVGLSLGVGAVLSKNRARSD